MAAPEPGQLQLSREGLDCKMFTRPPLITQAPRHMAAEQFVRSLRTGRSNPRVRNLYSLQSTQLGDASKEDRTGASMVAHG